MVNILFYDLLGEFKRQFYKDLLTPEHITGPQLKLDKLSFPNGAVDDEANFWGYVLEKDGVRYLLSSTDEEHDEIDLKETFPIFASKTIKVASKGNVYLWIQEYDSVKLKPEQTMTFKGMVDKFCSLKHTNPDHQKLLWFMTLTQMMDRANFRFCSPAGFGKDSTVDILGNLVGGANTVENPTLAKLEFLTHNKLLAINEVVDVSGGDWRNIQQFLLATGAHKPEVTKHSRATASGVKEILDISQFSMSLMYNDIDHYPIEGKFFDDVTKKAVKDRFPALRLYGAFNEDFNEIKHINIFKHVKDNFKEYEDLVRAFTYYKENLLSYYHKYDSTGLQTTFHTNHGKVNMSERWKINLGRLLKIIDVYCDTQDEFNSWLVIVNKSLQDYYDMLAYPDKVSSFMKKASEKEFKMEMDKIANMEVYTDRIKKIDSLIKGEKQITDKPVWDYEKEIL